MAQRGVCMSGQVSVTIQFPPNIDERINSACHHLSTDRASFLLDAVMEHLADAEDVYDAEQELCAIEQGQSKIYSLQEIKEKYELEP